MIRRIFALLERAFAAAGFAEAGHHDAARAILREHEGLDSADRRLFRKARAIAAGPRAAA